MHKNYGLVIIVACILILITSAMFADENLRQYAFFMFLVFMFFWEASKARVWKCPQCGYFFERAR